MVLRFSTSTVIFAISVFIMLNECPIRHKRRTGVPILKLVSDVVRRGRGFGDRYAGSATAKQSGRISRHKANHKLGCKTVEKTVEKGQQFGDVAEHEQCPARDVLSGKAAQLRGADRSHAGIPRNMSVLLHSRKAVNGPVRPSYEIVPQCVRCAFTIQVSNEKKH